MRSPSLPGVVLLMAALAAGSAQGYEFEIRATTLGQGYELRWFRLSERDQLLSRRRFTQSLRLDLWNLLEPDREHPAPPATSDLYFSSYFRFEHDFGSFVQPGLVDRELDVLYAHLGGRRLFGLVDFELGRITEVEALDWHSFDGLKVRVRTPYWVTMEASGGLMVRSASVMGSPTFEPDGTSSKGCLRFEEGSGSWVAADSCAQRQQLMPTWGIAAESQGRFRARLSYRRAESPGADLHPSSAWGVNEESAVASVRHSFFGGGLAPWAAVRWNFLLARVDEVQARVRLASSEHALTPELVHSYPSFDGDSIFNVFSAEPYTDVRLTYDVWPRRGRLRAYSRLWLRRFANTDDDQALEPIDDAWAWGGAAGARLGGADRGQIRVDLTLEDGYGGAREGADLWGRWQARRDLELTGRITLIRFDEDQLTELDGLSFAGMGSCLWRWADEVGFHLVAEGNVNRFNTAELRVMGLVDLAFRPEL